MKNTTLIPCLFLLSGSLFCQQDSLTRQQIDDQIWRPFIQHYESLDAESFITLHTSDMLRGGPWGLRTGAEYFAGMRQGWPKQKAAGKMRDIDFTFEYQVSGNEVAYEVGYYRVIEKKGAEERVYFGQFHVVLRKVDGIWKIAQNWDADEINGQPVTEKDFLKNAEMGILK